MTANPSTTAARAAVQALVDAGVRHAVLCPGSRSAPLAFALAAAERAGVLTLHVRADERTAGFLALGIGKATASPAAVVTTSGTAVANLMPAVVEAHHAYVPMVVLSANRPLAVRDTWANQTTGLQAGFFEGATRFGAAIDVTTHEDAPVLADAVSRAARAAKGEPVPGPAHVDAGFDEPLTPDADWFMPPPDDALVARRVLRGGEEPQALDAGLRTVVLAGDGAGTRAAGFAERWGLPLLAEPTSGARFGQCAVGPYRLLLDHPGLGERIEQVVVFGRPTLSRPVTRLLARPQVRVVLVSEPWRPGPPRPDVLRTDTAPVMDGERPKDWMDAWTVAALTAQVAIDDVLDQYPELTGLLVAREMYSVSGDLVIASSNPIRYADLAAHPGPNEDLNRAILANRGVAGIDGTVSTALGVAGARGGETRLLIGDLAFLHDHGALNIPAVERDRVRLQIVVINDDGGGIFGLLEYGADRYADQFERIFGTPHGADLGALCLGYRISHRLIGDITTLQSAFESPVPDGVSVLEIRCSRSGLLALHEQIRHAVGEALRH